MASKAWGGGAPRARGDGGNPRPRGGGGVTVRPDNSKGPNGERRSPRAPTLAPPGGASNRVGDACVSYQEVIYNVIRGQRN